MTVSTRYMLYFLISIPLVFGVSWMMVVVQQQKGQEIPETRSAADRSAPTMLYFHRAGCPHCAIANPIMAELQHRYQQTGWITVEVHPNMPADWLNTYQSWLLACNQTELITPLIVVGAGSENPHVYPGFGEEIESREPIENDIRQRLGLAPITLANSSIRLPVFGTLLVDDVSPQNVSKIVGILGGIHPVSWLMLCMVVYLNAGDRRTRTHAFVSYVCVALVLEALGLWFFGWRGDQGSWMMILRICLGVSTLVVAVILLMKFVTNKISVKGPWLFSIIVALATEQVLSNWTQSMHHHQGTSDGGTFLTLAMSVHVVLASLPYLHSMMFPPTPKARRVLCLIMGIALAQWSLILLTARLYSGTGPFWL